MNNKYVLSRGQNVRYVKEHLDEFIANNMALSRYEKDDPFYGKAYDNFVKSFDYILNNQDVENDYHCLLTLHDILMDGLDDGIKSELTSEQIEELSSMINQPAKSNMEIAIDVMLYILEKRLFTDGDVRAALAFANKLMVDNGCGFITILPDKKDIFRAKLKDYKETGNTDIKLWIYQYCIKGPKLEY